MAHPASAVTALFVPGDRPDRFAKAAAAGPDVVVIDLEDAVPPGAKEAALAAVLAALSPAAGLRALVRLNAAGTATYDREVGALAELAARPGHGLIGVLLPKAEDPAELARLVASVAAPGTALAVIPLVESALGVVRAFELASVPVTTRLAFGALDFTLDVAADLDSAAVAQARAQLVIGSRAAGIPAPLDSPSTDVRDLERVLAAARESRSAGFGGMLCIHPAQLPAVRAGFAPTAAEIEWAQAVIGSEGGDVQGGALQVGALQGGAVQVGGRMVDRPVVERARRILESR